MGGHYCWNCKSWYEDRSVGVAECENPSMSEDDYDKFCAEGGGELCPHFEAIHTDEELEEIAKAEEEMSEIDFWDDAPED